LAQDVQIRECIG